MGERNGIYSRLYKSYGKPEESVPGVKISGITSLLLMLYGLNQPHSEALKIDGDTILEILETKLYESLAYLENKKLAYKELEKIEQYGSVQNFVDQTIVKTDINSAPVV